MFSIKAQQLGYYVMVIDPNEDAPQEVSLTSGSVQTILTKKLLNISSKNCSGVTTELETFRLTFSAFLRKNWWFLHNKALFGSVRIV